MPSRRCEGNSFERENASVHQTQNEKLLAFVGLIDLSTGSSGPGYFHELLGFRSSDRYPSRLRIGW